MFATLKDHNRGCSMQMIDIDTNTLTVQEIQCIT